ncbi:MAG: DUF2083 domain-containing protein [Deltaproteobacteria bacterium]|nr:DUF2083 domain-containing protein [Deltaproteobacteria bacterium]
MSEPKLGAKVRALRRRENLTQMQLAERLSISASYLNLIEHNRRPLSAQLLIRLAQIFALDLQAFATEGEDQLVSDLLEALGDPVFDAYALTGGEVRDFAANNPQVARALLALYRTWHGARDTSSSDPSEDSVQTEQPGEEVIDLIQKHRNYFPEIEEAAEVLTRVARTDQRDLVSALSDYVRAVHGIEVRWLGPVGPTATRFDVRRYDAVSHVLELSETLVPSSRAFQLAHQIALLDHSDLLDRIARDQTLTSPEARALARIALANYFAGAVMMPYLRFLEFARSRRYDIDLLCHRFGVSFEQVCHRLTTLHRPGHEGVAFHFLRVDIAGNVSKRFSASGFRFARFSGACALWNEHRAFAVPGVLRVQISVMPDGQRYLGIARTVQDPWGSHKGSSIPKVVGLGCEIAAAAHVVYADGLDLASDAVVVPIGSACRVCERMTCVQRAFPSRLWAQKLDENVRGRSFYVSVDGAN